MIYILTILIIISLMSLIYLTYYPIKKYKILAKSITSILFVLICINSYFYSKGDFEYFIFLLLGLIFSVLGDIFLAIESNHKTRLTKMFLYGLISFSLAHVSYICAFSHLNPLTLKDIICSLIISFILITSLKFKKGFDFKNLFVPSYIYCMIISLMFCKAMSLVTTNIHNFGFIVLIIGVILFVISDIILSFILFYKNHSKLLPALNLITYYIAQFLIASTVIFI